MPHFLPFQQITMVSGLSREVLEERLLKHTRNNREISQLERSSKVGYLGSRPKPDFLFRGIVQNGQFFLIPYQPYPEHFQPKLVGHIEETSLGSILFIRFELLRGTLFFAILSGLIFLLIGVVFLLLQKNIWSFILTMLFFLGSYWVMLLNFHQKARIAEKLFAQAIEKI